MIFAASLHHWRWSRFGGTAATLLILSLGLGSNSGGAAEPPAGTPAPGKLAFTTAAPEFHFDTGVLRGSLRSAGKSLGLGPIIESAANITVARGYGLLSHYRLLDAETRYGTAAWDWTSQAQLLPDGAVQVTWSADEQHPFAMQAVYRWSTPQTLDVTTQVTPQKNLSKFEVFLASYFEGFAAPFVYVQGGPETNGRPGFVEATQALGDWQMFPRDAAAVKLIGDGRWRRPPNPVDWKIRPQLAGALALRRDAQTGRVGLIMAPPEDCFAVSTPFTGEGHRSLYFSLFGQDLTAGQTAKARARLSIGHQLTDAQAIAAYEAYLKELRSPAPTGK